MATFGSLFAGVGGFDIGFDNAGWECGFQVEWDKHCQQVLTHHWPEVPKWWDVSEVNGAELPPVDLITFGSPCQDLSLAGKRAGLMEGSRSNLFFEATRIIKEMRDATNGQYPRWAIWENVAGAFSSNKGEDFDAVLQEMVNIGGHHVEWHCMDAQFYGVPQRRRRVFVIACFDPSILKRGGQALLPVGEGRRRNTSSRSKERKAIASTLGESVDASGPELGSGDSIANTISASLYHHGTVVNQDANNGHVVVEPILIDGTRVDDVRIYESPVQTLISRMGTGGNNVPMVAVDHNDAIGFSHTQGLDAQPSEETFPTLRVGGAGQAVAYTTSNIAGTLAARDYKGVGNQYVEENKLIIEADIAPTLRSGGDGGVPSSRGEHLVVEAYDEYNDALGGHVHQALRAGTKQSTGVLTGMVVRRLTPVECERLMGWPDNHTLYRADGTTNSDTTRYKMCGNGVASPVAQWIAEHLLGFHTSL
jgi:DNA (cytosine-5)-methyltransferase 1